MSDLAAARWRGVAQTLVLVLCPILLWCRDSALRQEPEIERLAFEVRALESQVKTMEGQLGEQSNAAAQQLKTQEEQFAEERAKLLKLLAAKDAKCLLLKNDCEQWRSQVVELQATLAAREERRPVSTRRASIPGRTYPQATDNWWERY